MQTNKLIISINKPIHEVFLFTITPPNSKYWIPGISNETTNELSIRTGTVYTLMRTTGESFKVTLTDFKQDKMITFISTDKNYHCRYTYNSLDEKSCKLEYYEWVDKGELDEPFTLAVLEKLKSVLEAL
jgi:hypothetical protein